MLCRGQSQHCTVNPSEDWGNGDTQRRGEEMTLMVWSRQCRSSPSTLGNATFPTLRSAFIIKTVPPHTLKISGGKRKAGQICDIDFFSIHWLEFKFKVENYSPWGRRNLSVGGTNTKSSRIGVLLFLSDSACNQSCHHYLLHTASSPLPPGFRTVCSSFVRILLLARGAGLTYSLWRYFDFYFQSYEDVSNVRRISGDWIMAKVKKRRKRLTEEMEGFSQVCFQMMYFSRLIFLVAIHNLKL